MIMSCLHTSDLPSKTCIYLASYNYRIYLVAIGPKVRKVSQSLKMALKRIAYFGTDSFSSRVLCKVLKALPDL